MSPYSRKLAQTITSIIRFLWEFIRQMKFYLTKQFHFFKQFNYAGANIKNHFMNKAAHFFGMEESKLTGLSQPKRHYLRYISENNTDSNRRKSGAKNAYFEKNRKKRRANYYRLSNELNS